MPPPELAVQPHRPTIIVGYGDFGLGLLRRFLGTAALRGVLNWEEPPGGARPTERRLRDLALLWLPDLRADRGRGDQVSATEGDYLEMRRNLYRQIRRVAGIMFGKRAKR